MCRERKKDGAKLRIGKGKGAIWESKLACIENRFLMGI